MSTTLRISYICYHFINRLFLRHENPPNVASTPPPLFIFIARTLHRTNLPPSVPFAALILLRRLKSRYPITCCSSGYGLFITALVIATKVLINHPYSNKSWATFIDGAFTLGKLNDMERTMCNNLDWDVGISAGFLGQFVAMMEIYYFTGAGL